MLFHAALVTVIFLARCTSALYPSLYSNPNTPLYNTKNIAKTSPSRDSFYKVPANISSYAQGAIIQARQVSDVSGGIYGPAGGSIFQLQFRSNGVHMQPDAAVTTVVAPKYPAKGPPRIVAIATAVDSAAIDCALSWGLYPDTAAQGASGNKIFATFAQAALHQGYYVTLPDQEGSKATWLAYSEGQVILDSIIALANHNATIPNSQGYQAAILGYSGGGHGAAWAGQLASTYAPNIPIVALAAGGIPVDLGLSLKYLDGKIASALAFSGLGGLSNAYPELNQLMLSILLQNGTEAFVAMRDNTHCLTNALLKYPFKSIIHSVTKPGFLDSPLCLKILDENFLGKQQQPITKVHTQEDDIVPYAPALAYYQSQCAKGAKIILTSPPSGHHMLTEVESFPSFVYFIKGAFEGTLKVAACRQQNDYLINFAELPAINTVSLPVVNQLIRLAGLYKTSEWIQGSPILG